MVKFHWKPEMMNMTQSAAVQDVKQLTDTHITVLLTEYAALQTALPKATKPVFTSRWNGLITILM